MHLSPRVVPVSGQEVIQVGGSGRRWSPWVVAGAVAATVTLLAVGSVAARQLAEERADCGTRVVLASLDGGDQVVYDHADQSGGDVLRKVVLSDEPLAEDFLYAGPSPRGRIAQLWLTSVDVDDPLSEGAEFEIGGGAEGRREFAPLDVADDQLIGGAVRPATGSLVVTSVADDGTTCLRVDYANDQATLVGTVAIVVTDDDEDRGQ